MTPDKLQEAVLKVEIGDSIRWGLAERITLLGYDYITALEIVDEAIAEMDSIKDQDIYVKGPMNKAYFIGRLQRRVTNKD
jgi:hypothetical protein